MEFQLAAAFFNSKLRTITSRCNHQVQHGCWTRKGTEKVYGRNRAYIWEDGNDRSAINNVGNIL